MESRRADRIGPHRRVYDKNRKRVLASQDICGICGRPVDKSLKFPDPMSAVIDHIIPVNKGGSPDDIDNLQLAHMCCNRAKSDFSERQGRRAEETGKRDDYKQEFAAVNGLDSVQAIAHE